MNTKSPLLATVLGLALCSGLALAAVPPAAPADPVPPTPPGGFHGRFAEKLGLSADQVKAIEELRAKQHAEMMALLTPEQQQKADEMRGQMKERFQRLARGRPPGGRDGGRGPGAARGPGMQAGPAGNPLAIVALADRIKDRLAEKLQLTDEQRDKLEQLGRAYRAEQRAATKKHFEEMRAVLTPEQQQKFDEMKQRGPAGGHPPFVGMDDNPEDHPAGERPPPPEAGS